MYEYRVDIVRVVDGDTVDVDIDLGFGVWLKKQRVRLYGIDTPESRTRDLNEKNTDLWRKNISKKGYQMELYSKRGSTVKVNTAGYLVNLLC